jgi:hypothetical protein
VCAQGMKRGRIASAVQRCARNGNWG